MKRQYDPQTDHRRSVRLQGYDYAQVGAYYVTICTHSRACILGEVIDGAIRVSAFGQIVSDRWSEIPSHFPQTELDEFVVMPNHVHGIIVIVGEKGGRGSACCAPTPSQTQEFGKMMPGSLSTIVRAFKSAAARQINVVRGTPGATVWQRGFYEHVIRDEDDMNRVRQYIMNNPLRWDLDHENPS